ncbi:Golgi resident protein GCP60 [Pseudolycoriella hygida]|uniref:Golgi resident protein GCP60 n=1 Tax=Pseudolycoriella hygida TaxID=35572 RepID=A0A9Q0RVW3_9DIPT|nr:Golgi resident protein GCP60 [Pseudolycoriella hygida]
MDNLDNRLQNIVLNADDNANNDGDKWGMPLKELYRLAMTFYKDKSGKAVHFSYEDNLKLVAFTQQASHGPLDIENASPLGVLDVIGRDRRTAWQQLGKISKGQAMEGFIGLLDHLCPLFKPYIEAIKKDREEKYRLAIENEQKQKELQKIEEQRSEEQRKVEEQKNREEMQKRQLQDALNQQTFHQFKAYAEKQYPGNPDQQAVLIRQLQTEHYHQYMQQLQLVESVDRRIIDGEPLLQTIDGAGQAENVADEQPCGDSDQDEYPVVSPPSMWTRPDIEVFKQEVSSGQGDGVVRVGHGDTVTVRVPTHTYGSTLFWEFATDSYDVGFGVYFEWGKPLTTEVSVHISESDEEDGLDDEDDLHLSGDLESGANQQGHIPPTISRNRPLTTSIIPVYRRECQNEVYVGSHKYPGEGVYLLKFDNSYSLWRSKTLYYRVYYTR